MHESTVEEAALAWLGDLGYDVRHGPAIAPGEPLAERDNHGQVLLEDRLRQALARINPTLPAEALEDAFRKLIRADGPTVVARNHALHRMLVDGVNVEYRRKDGSIAIDALQRACYYLPICNTWLIWVQTS
jgi:type I restriction enzyme R subunit